MVHRQKIDFDGLYKLTRTQAIGRVAAHARPSNLILDWVGNATHDQQGY